MVRQNNVAKAFLYSLAVISIIGFIAIIGISFFDFTLISDNADGIILMALGVGLMFEGQIRRWAKFRHGGINNTEITHFITGIVGIFAVIAGFLSIVGIDNPTLSSLKGIIASVAIIVIIIQTWFVK